MCSCYNLTVLDLCFDCAPLMFRLSSTCISTLLDLFFDFARPIIRLCLICVSTKIDLCFDLHDRNWVCVKCARLKFGPCSTYVSPVLDLSFNSLHRNQVCSECAWLMFQPCSIHILSVLEQCLTFSTRFVYVSSALDLYFDCARPMFWLCSKYVSTLLDYN